MRTEVLAGCARPEGLDVIVYHGLVQGLTLLLTRAPVPLCPQRPERPRAALIPHDPQFVRLLANLLLRRQSEGVHVY